jgi:hypothetical protein
MSARCGIAARQLRMLHQLATGLPGSPRAPAPQAAPRISEHLATRDSSPGAAHTRECTPAETGRWVTEFEPVSASNFQIIEPCRRTHEVGFPGIADFLGRNVDVPSCQERPSTATVGIDMFGARCQPHHTGHLANRRCAASSSMKVRSCRRSRFLATARKRISIRTVLGWCHVFRTRRAES